MILNITNEIVNELDSKLSDVAVLREYPQTQPKFPCVIIEEGNLDIDLSSMDSGGYKYTNYELTLEIYTTGGTKISKCYEIRSKIDQLMSGQYRFQRIFSDRIPNLDTNVYRYRMTFVGKIDENRVVYRR